MDPATEKDIINGVNLEENIENNENESKVNSAEMKEVSETFGIEYGNVDSVHNTIQTNAAGLDYHKGEVQIDAIGPTETDSFREKIQTESAMNGIPDPECACINGPVENLDNSVKELTCGGCSKTFTTVCLLHKHLKSHGSDGSYYFCQKTLTAYPKFDATCSYVQTDTALFHEEVEEVPEVKAKSSLRATKVVETKTKTKRSEPKIKQKTETRGRKRKLVTTETTSLKKTKTVHTKPEIKKTRLGRKCKKKEDILKLPKRQLNTTEISVPVSEMLEKDQDRVKLNAGATTIKQTKKGANKVKKGKKNVPKKKETKPELDIEPEVEDVNEEESCSKNDGHIYTQQEQEIEETKEPVVEKEAEHMNNESNYLDEDTDVDDSLVDNSVDNTEEITNDSEYMISANESMNSIDEDKKPAVKRRKKKEPNESEDTKIKDNAKTPKEKKKREKRTQEDLYQSCEICNEIILQKKMKDHMVMHTGEKSFICEICGQAYAKNSNLYRHKITHREVKPFQCSFCPAQFCRKKDFTYHVNSHKGYRPHVCNVCDMRFLTNKGLIQHQENIHMGITKFQCDFCDRRFFKKSGLYAHRATHFEATLECQYCDRKFRDKCGLNKHERTHTGKKHYQCHVCEHAFNQCTPYYQHMEKRHNMDRGSIKDIMKIVIEAKKRNGQKVDLFRVPDNIDEIVTNLKLEEQFVKTTPGSQVTIGEKYYGLMKSNPVSENATNLQVTESVLNHEPVVQTVNNLHLRASESLVFANHQIPQNSPLTITSPDNCNMAISLQTLEPLKPIPVMIKSEEEIKQLYGEQALTELQTHPQPIQPTENVLNFSVSDQTGQGTSLMSLEPVKTLLQTSGHPKQKMKLLSHYAEYQQQKVVPSQSGDIHEKMPEVPATVSMATYGQQVVSQGSAGIDPLTDAYGTCASDFLEHILQGH